MGDQAPDDHPQEIPPEELGLAEPQNFALDWENGQATPLGSPGPSAEPDVPHPGIPKQDENGKPLAFPDEHKLKFRGLLHIGYLTETFTFLGHEFVIRTLNDGELLEVALLHEKWSGTMGANKAYQMAMVAASVVSVDGQMMPAPLGDEAHGDRFSAAFEKVKQWYPPTNRVIYSQLLALDTEVDKVVKAMGGALG